MAQRVLVGAHDDHAGPTVDHDLIAVVDELRHPLASDHHRDAQRTGHDRGVAGPPPRIGGEAEHLVHVERRGLGGREIVGHDDDRFLQAGEAVPALSDELVEQTSIEVEHVPR